MKRIAALIAAALVLACSVCCAQEIDLSRTGSITVSFQDEAGNPIKDNGEIRIYKLADAAMENGSLVYKKTAAFSGLNIDVSHIDPNSAPYTILGYIRQNEQTCGYADSAKAGAAVSFRGLSSGIYFVTQYKLPRNYKYYQMSSFIVSIPMEEKTSLFMTCLLIPKWN